MKASEPITFRLSPTDYAALVKVATKQNITIHQLARQMVIDRLSLQDIEASLSSIAQDVETLKARANSTEETVTLVKQGVMAAFEVLFVEVAKFQKSESIRWAYGNDPGNLVSQG